MIDEPTLAQWLEQARSLVAERKLLHALQLYHKITAASPELDIAWVELGYVQFELKQYESAEKTLLRAVSTSAEPQEILFLVGNLYLKLEQYQKALTYYKKLLGEQKTLADDLRAHLNFNAALAYYYKDNIRLAEIHFRATRRIDPRFPKINESLGELLLRRGAYAEAVECLKKAIASERYSWIARYGGFDFHRSKFNRAVQAPRQVGSIFKPIVGLACLAFGQTDFQIQFYRLRDFAFPFIYADNEFKAEVPQKQDVHGHASSTSKRKRF